MKNIIKPLAKSVLIPLWLTATSAADAGIQWKVLGFGTTILIISNDEMEDIMKIVRGVSETIQNELKKDKRGFLGY